GDVMLVTVISTIFIGWVAIIAGAFEIVHAFWTKGWGGFVWQVLLGILYIAFGVVLVGQPVASALILTYVLGMMLLISGLVRIPEGWQVCRSPCDLSRNSPRHRFLRRMVCFLLNRATQERSYVPLREWPGVIKALAVVTMMALGLAAALLPAQAEQGAAVLFQNVRI